MLVALTFIFKVALGVVLVAVGVGGLFYQFGPNAEWRREALRNRQRHPDLLTKYDRARDEQERFLIAQSMLARDLEKLHESGAERPDGDPDVWDYHVPFSPFGKDLAVQSRRMRAADTERLQKKAATVS
jgi:hypothetical protein